MGDVSEPPPSRLGFDSCVVDSIHPNGSHVRLGVMPRLSAMETLELFKTSLIKVLKAKTPALGRVTDGFKIVVVRAKLFA